MIVGQVNNIVLQPVVYGISLNYGQIGQLSTPTATDCKGTTVTVSSYTYGSQNMGIVDINPKTGALCAGTWNRNQNVIPDYTVCTPPANPSASNSVTYVTAEANGVTSNAIPVYIHPVVSSVVLGTPSTNCTTDPATNCCPLAANNPITAPPYSGNSCISQATTGQLVARVFSGTGTYDPTTGTTSGSLQNISCQAGHLTFSAQTSGIVSIDENGVATAQQPGSTVISANVANAGSSAGFFSTCPPVKISLSVPNNPATSISVGQNFSQPLTAVATDQNNTTLNGLALEFVSTTPTTIPVSSGGTVTPPFPGSASITALCQPPTCNPSPFNQIGLFGNGKSVTSNSIGITTPGSNTSLVYIASTNSRYLVPVDLSVSGLGAPVQLPFVPNSMVISTDGSSIYMGSSTELMVVSGTTDGITRQDTTVPGTVLAVSPDNTQVVIADAARKLIYIEAAAGGITSQYGWSGQGTPHAEWSPDSQTVYIVTGDPTAVDTQLLVYSTFTGWNNAAAPNGDSLLDVAVTVPSIGAYLASAKETTAVGYCPITTVSTVNGQTTTSNVFYPTADVISGAPADRISATNDGLHILGATASNDMLTDFHLTLPATQSAGTACPSSGGALQFSAYQSGTPTPYTTTALSGVTPSAITGVLPATDSDVAAITYMGTGGVLPLYAPVSGTGATPGTVTNVPLSGSATAPVAGVWSSDNLTFFTGTAGDNLVHLITRSAIGKPFSDSKTLAPNLPAASGTGVAVPNLIVQYPRKTT